MLFYSLIKKFCCVVFQNQICNSEEFGKTLTLEIPRKKCLWKALFSKAASSMVRSCSFTATRSSQFWFYPSRWLIWLIYISFNKWNIAKKGCSDNKTNCIHSSLSFIDEKQLIALCVTDGYRFSDGFIIYGIIALVNS